MLFFNSKNFISCSLSKERKRFYFHLFLVRIRKRSHLSFGQFCASLQSPSSWPPRMIHCRCELDKESRTKVWCEAVLIFLSLVRTASITYLYYHSSTCARLSPSHGVICLGMLLERGRIYSSLDNGNLKRVHGCVTFTRFQSLPGFGSLSPAARTSHFSDIMSVLAGNKISGNLTQNEWNAMPSWLFDLLTAKRVDITLQMVFCLMNYFPLFSTCYKF